MEGKQRGRQRVEAIRGSGRDDSELEGKREGGTVEGKGGREEGSERDDCEVEKKGGGCVNWKRKSGDDKESERDDSKLEAKNGGDVEGK